ncbi:hypothetical protein EK904_009961 [Melospiza melodia maxima]|nr:hypothetical protein EK904_009961 [Melospiza melodia maxima]
MGDKDEIKRGLLCCCSSCLLGHLCIFTHKGFSFKIIVCKIEDYLNFGTRVVFFLLLVAFVCLYGKTKKIIFAAKAFSQCPVIISANDDPLSKTEHTILRKITLFQGREPRPLAPCDQPWHQQWSSSPTEATSMVYYYRIKQFDFSHFQCVMHNFLQLFCYWIILHIMMVQEKGTMNDPNHNRF